MFTSVSKNKYSDSSLRIVSVCRFHFSTYTRNKTFSEEIEELRRDIPADSSTRVVFRHLAWRIVYAEQATSCNIIRKVFWWMRQTKIAVDAQNGLEITFNSIHTVKTVHLLL